MKEKENNKSARRLRFENDYGSLNETEIQKEILYLQQLNLEKLERVRANTSNLVWFLIVIPIIIGVLLSIVGINI